MASETVQTKEDEAVDLATRRRSTRIEEKDPYYVEWDESTTPRLGRRESEPHSSQISYLYDVLSTNFPKDRTLWDLHHYFMLDGEEIDIQFDISYFRGYKIPYTLSSYRASEHGNRVPTMALNVLSRSTFYKDLGITVDRCYRLGIPVYVIFNPYLVHIRDYRAPFLRVYYRAETETKSSATTFYSIKELRSASFTKEGALDPEKIIDVGGSVLPFRFAIQELEQKHQGNLPQYRLVLVHPTKLEIFKTRAEQERQRAEEALKRVKELEEMIQKLQREK